ncbi:MAG: hypothetical protein HY904_06650 [Deltaproteobacteria bacterium]|nr:hypothetical protein [Deltaproteobacteria bacterium]
MTPGTGGTRTLTCAGNVKVWRDDLSLTCQRAVLEFGSDSTLRTAHCVGAVRIQGPQGTAQAAEARFDAARNSVTLTGRPRAAQAGSVLEGQVIRLDVVTGEITVEGATGVVDPGLAPGVKP